MLVRLELERTYRLEAGVSLAPGWSKATIWFPDEKEQIRMLPGRV